MNYEQKYKEALERAKDLHDNHALGMPFIYQTCKEIFPILKESEDERIRKALIKYLDALDDDEIRYGVSFKDMRTWLEKQANIPHFTFDDILALQCAMKATEKADNELYEQLKSLHDRLHDVYWLEEQGEQKPQSKSPFEVWKDMRFEVYQQASGNRHEPNYSDDSTKMFSLTDIDEIFEKVAEKQGKQKPSWNEEDENMFKSLNKLLNEASCYSCTEGVDKILDWLKSLRDRVQTQPKQEWSDEDEEMYNEVLTDIIYTKNDLKTKGCLGLSERAMKAFNWFSTRHKSLRPQSKWKPSEEQMEALKKRTHGLHESSETRKALESLINDLKNL